MSEIFAQSALLPDGWASNVRVTIGKTGRIDAVVPNQPAPSGQSQRVGILLPAPGNLHSHAFQRAMAGLTEHRRGKTGDSFWSWRDVLYRFIEHLNPDQLTAIASLLYVEMLEAGYASVGEFHYIHHQRDGGAYDNPAQMSLAIVEAAQATGMGLTLLPVYYAQAGLEGGALAGGQRRFGNDLESFSRLHEAARSAIATLPDAQIGVAPHSLRAVPAQALGALVDTYGDGPIHIHIAEQMREVRDVEAHLGARPVAWLLDNARVDQRWCLVHATHMNDGEATRLAASGAVVGLCPITEANLGDGIFAGAEFLKAGGRFGIGSDANVRVALAEELRSFEYSQRLRYQARNVVAGGGASTGRCLFDKTVAGSAQALARPTGKIKAGGLADLVALEDQALALDGLSGDAALDAWIFCADDRLVRDVWVAGRQVVTQGVHFARAPIGQKYRAVARQLRDLL
ncbi:MAG: formimidoylglutamate deiminase [Alphaproteobacteria bacterium]